MDLPLKPILFPILADYLGQTLTPEVMGRMASRILAASYPGPVDIAHIAPRSVGTYTMRPERLISVVPDLVPLHVQHWQETEVHRADLVMRADYQRVIDLEDQGRYVVIVVRDQAGVAVGNYGLYLSQSTHTQTLTATEDTLFLAKPHRKGRLGVAMIRYAEDVLAQMGVRELNVSVKLVNDTGPMIERMGYLPVGKQYTKILKEAADVLA